MPAIVSSEVQSRNPLGQRADRFRRGRLLLFTRRQDVAPAGTAEPGTIRRWVRGLAAYTGGPAVLSWTKNAMDVEGRPAGPVSTPERFLISSTNVLRAGNQLSNPMLREVVPSRIRQAIPSASTMQQGRPSVRYRIRSLGSRVAPVNPPLPGGDIEASS